ncbi:hypothetical protein MRB53_025951 [Persea americana]|uniref:Uncharacterized protein n=1 Tax=Persea americana TaxID=3435 RepID=A0ACC2LH80_PERAE|nr:hypothetical protein MRB53_025951 [Persea americana]
MSSARGGRRGRDDGVLRWWWWWCGLRVEEEGATARRHERDEEQRDWRGELPLRWVYAGGCEMERERAKIERERR